MGGTWYWNRYPGARCDVESMEYSYQFDEDLQQEWEWTERYVGAAGDPALREPRRRPVRPAPHIRFDTRVDRCGVRRGRPVGGASHRPRRPVSAQFLVMATGCLSSTNMPDFPGIADFAGRRTTPAGGRTRGSTSPASESGSSAPAPPASRRSRSSPRRPPISPCSSARRTTRSRRATRRSTGLRGAGQARYREFRQANSRMRARSGSTSRRTDQPALEADAWRSARRSTTRWYAEGGLDVPRRLRRPAARTGMPTRPPRSSSATRSARSSPTRRSPTCSRRNRSSAASACASTPATSRRSTARTSTWSTSARRRSSDSRRPGCARAGATTSSTASSSPPASTR